MSRRWTVTLEFTDEEIDALVAGVYDAPKDERYEADPEYRRAFMREFFSRELRQIGSYYRWFAFKHVAQAKDKADDALVRINEKHAALWDRKADEFGLEVAE